MTILKTPQEKYDELEKEFLVALDSFYESWHRKAKICLDKNDDPVEFVGTIMKDYAMGNLETIPGLHKPRQCSNCGCSPDELSWVDHEEDHWTDDGGQEFTKQKGMCNCSEINEWAVTYLMLPIEMSEVE